MLDRDTAAARRELEALNYNPHFDYRARAVELCKRDAARIKSLG